MSKNVYKKSFIFLTIIVFLTTIAFVASHFFGFVNIADLSGGGLSDATISGGTFADVSITGSFTGSGSSISNSETLNVTIPDASKSGAGLYLTKGNTNSVIKYVTSGSQPADDSVYTNTYSDEVNISMGGNITSINSTPTAGGLGYTNGDIVTITGGNSDATVKVESTSNPNGVLTATVTDGGSGYSNGDTLTFTTGDGNATAQVTTDGGTSAVAHVTVHSGGSGYFPYEMLTITGGNNDAVFVVGSLGDNGTILSGIIYSGGTGYTSGTDVPTSAFSGHGLTLDITTGVGAVTGFNNITSGTGYSTGAGQATSYAGAGIGCTANITSLYNGIVTGVSLVGGGGAYSTGAGQTTSYSGAGSGLTVDVTDTTYNGIIWLLSTAEDGNTKLYYKIIVAVAPPPNTDATIGALSKIKGVTITDFGTPSDLSISGATVHTPGSGYNIFNVVTVNGGDGRADFWIMGTDQENNDGVTGGVIMPAGTGYISATDVGTTGGNGTGLTLDIVANEVTATGSITLTSAQAINTSNTGSFITSFVPNDLTGTVEKVVKYASGATPDFSNDTAYNNQAISDGDFFMIKVVAQDTTTILYYKIVVTVTQSGVVTHTLTYTPGSGGLITGDLSQTIDNGEDGTQVTAVPSSGYRFLKWSDNSTTNPRTDTNVTEDKTLTAIFEKISSGGGGLILREIQAQQKQQQPTKYQFTRYLKFGDKGDDVKQLQIFLNNHGFVLAKNGVGSPSHETTLFGTLTKKTLIRFQEAYSDKILKPSGFKKGTGMFSKYTMQFVNDILLNEK